MKRQKFTESSDRSPTSSKKWQKNSDESPHRIFHVEKVNATPASQ